MKEKLMIKPDHFFIYPKDKNGKPTGHTICIYQRDGKNFIGEAICSEADTFNKQKGRELALSRAMQKAIKSVNEYLKKSETKKLVVTHSDYREDCDFNRYSGESPKPEHRNHYRVTKIVQPGYKFAEIKRLIVKHSPKDKVVSNKWKDLILVDIKSDGNGLDVTVRDSIDKTKTFRLNYSQVNDLKLALKKYGEHNRSGKFVRVK